MPPVPKLLASLAACILLPAAAAALDIPSLFPEAADIGSGVPHGEIETYTPENLWEKINGEAELFRRFDVVGAAFARYEHRSDIDRSLEIAVYDFPDSLSAFGIFATFTSPDEPREDLGNGAVIGEYQGYLWHGRHFVTANAFGPPEERAASLRNALTGIASSLGPAPALPPPLERFMRVADPATVSYRPDHLLGREVLPPGLEGDLTGGTRIFRATEAGASEGILSAYRAFLENPTEGKRDGITLLSGTDPLLGPVTIAIRGEHLAGARALPGGEGLPEVLRKLLRADP